MTHRLNDANTELDLAYKLIEELKFECAGLLVALEDEECAREASRSQLGSSSFALVARERADASRKQALQEKQAGRTILERMKSLKAERDELEAQLNDIFVNYNNGPTY